MIWKQEITLSELNALSKNTMGENMGLSFTQIGDDFLEATIPVDERNKQPMGLLHGGASVALAETLGSVAASLCIQNPKEEAAVGIEINANHLRSVRSGLVTGRVRPAKIGKQLQVWNIELFDERQNLVCTSRLTTMTIKI
ncbi:hotdog fold thioesterase [Membranihabitans marinus]|uniref:hotdog fold thioesterase n=1 Tax=Membranihabitans marinus TaxID=1227546 RepID=UPI001F02874F|nr:hotdog fold thioesterase [Membranihabitans marinus]